MYSVDAEDAQLLLGYTDVFSDEMPNLQEEINNMNMHKAISIIQFKIEGRLSKILEFKLEHRNLLHLIDYENGLIELDGKHMNFWIKTSPTIDPKTAICIDRSRRRGAGSFDTGICQLRKITEPYAFPFK